MAEQTNPACEKEADGERTDIRKGLDETEAPARVEIRKDDDQRDRRPDPPKRRV